MNTGSDNPPSSQDGLVCPKCLLRNATTAAFCSDCGAPIGMVANVDPLQHIYAEGFGYRSAVDGPPSLIVLIGIWLLCGPFLIVGPSMLLDHPGDRLPSVIPLTLFSAGAAVILYRTTRNYLVKIALAKKSGS